MQPQLTLNTVLGLYWDHFWSNSMDCYLFFLGKEIGRAVDNVDLFVWVCGVGRV